MQHAAPVHLSPRQVGLVCATLHQSSESSGACFKQETHKRLHWKAWGSTALLTSHVCHLQVDFEAVPDLVAHRKVFLHQGQAYIHRTEVTSLVVGHFRWQLVICCHICHLCVAVILATSCVTHLLQPCTKSSSISQPSLTWQTLLSYPCTCVLLLLTTHAAVL